MKKPVICFLFSSRLMQSARPRSSPEGTRITTFLIVQCSYCHIWVFASFQFHCSVLTIFLVDGLEIKMVAGRCQATAGRRQKMRCGGTGEGRPHKGVLEISRRHFECLVTIWILLFQISHSYVSHWVFQNFGGRIRVFKNGNHYCWAERIVVWLSSEPPHKSYMVTLHPGSVFLMENLALINDWVN